MSTYFFIKSKLDGNVIDIQNIKGDDTTSGALLDAYPQKTTGTDNQLWEFVPDPAGSGYFFIKSKLDGNVIDIQGSSSKSKVPLDVFRQKAAGTVQESNNQLWQFLQDPAGSGYCFIMSKLNGNVIDIQESSTKSGALLDSYPMKATGTDNQLWTVVGGAFPSPVSAVPAPSKGLRSNSNYILYNDCNPVTVNGAYLAVVIDVTEDIVCQSASGSTIGFSFQLNCYSPKNHQLAYQQFVLQLLGSDLQYNIQGGKVGGAPLFNVGGSSLTSLPGSNVPAGYQLVIGFQSDNDGGLVSGAFFIVRDNLGNTLADQSTLLSSIDGVPPPSVGSAPVNAFELNLVGPDNSEAVVLSSGAGTITYIIDGGSAKAPEVLSVLSELPSCVDTTGETLETANSVYGVLPSRSSNIFKQSFNISPP
jgi:hypothetical protein